MKWSIGKQLLATTTRCNLHPPSPPVALQLYLGRAGLCQGRSPYNSPWEHDSSRSMAPEQQASEQRGGVCSCASVPMPGEGDNSLALCPTSSEKLCFHRSEHNGLSNGCVVCLPVASLSPAVICNYWSKAYWESSMVGILKSLPVISAIYTWVHVLNVKPALLCISHTVSVTKKLTKQKTF